MFSLRNWMILAWMCLLCLASFGSVPGVDWTVVERGRSHAVVVHSEKDTIAAARLTDQIRKYAPIQNVAPLAGREEPIRILVGTLDSNEELRQVANAAGIAAQIEALPAEGYLLRTLERDGKRYLLCAGGDYTGALYATADVKNFYLRPEGASVILSPLNRTEVPKLKYRWFWNWDIRTNWDLLNHDDVYHRIVNKSESIRPNFKSPGAYLTNMKMVINYMSEHKLNGLIIWGFLRDNHGGVEAAQELCRYASERGVKIIPGVNVDRLYGGIYHEGDHPYNLETWLRRHPELRAIDKDGKPMSNALCAQKPQNRAWIKEAIQWLYKNFDIGGVNLEFSEHDVCYTKDCIHARAQMPGDDPPFYKDLARAMPFVVDEIYRIDPNTVITYATYGGFAPGMDDPRSVKLIPDYAVAQWTLTRMLYDLIGPLRGWKEGYPWPDGLRPPSKRSIGYLQWGSTFTAQEKSFLHEAYRVALAKAARHGFEGIITYGEESPIYPNVELSYLSFGEFSYNPELSLDEFLETRLAPMYGGVESARRAWELAAKIGDIHRDQKVANKPGLLDLAYEGSRSADERGKDRWNRIIDFIRELI